MYGSDSICGIPLLHNISRMLSSHRCMMYQCSVHKTKLYFICSADLLDCSTGTMEQLVGEFRVQAALSACTWSGLNARARVTTSLVQVGVHVPRLRALRALAADWRAAIDKVRNSFFIEAFRHTLL